MSSDCVLRQTYVPTPPEQKTESHRRLLMPGLTSNLKKRFGGVTLTEKDAQEDSPQNSNGNLPFFDV